MTSIRSITSFLILLIGLTSLGCGQSSQTASEQSDAIEDFQQIPVALEQEDDPRNYDLYMDGDTLRARLVQAFANDEELLQRVQALRDGQARRLFSVLNLGTAPRTTGEVDALIPAFRNLLLISNIDHSRLHLIYGAILHNNDLQRIIFALSYEELLQMHREVGFTTPLTYQEVVAAARQWLLNFSRSL